MKKLFVTLLVVVVGIVGVGFYRGWFTVNQDKIQQDEQLAREKVRELTDEMKAKSKAGVEKAK